MTPFPQQYRDRGFFHRFLAEDAEEARRATAILSTLPLARICAAWNRMPGDDLARWVRSTMLMRATHQAYQRFLQGVGYA